MHAGKACREHTGLEADEVSNVGEFYKWTARRAHQEAAAGPLTGAVLLQVMESPLT